MPATPSSPQRRAQAALALAAAALLAPNLARAQSSVTLAGIIDLGLRVDSGATGGRVSSLSSGQMYGSRLAFMGTEDLGGGLKTGFVLESGLAMDTGSGTANPPGAPAGALAFGRTSALSIGSDATGYLSMGRQYTPLWALSASGSNDPFVGSWLGGNSVVYSNTVLVSNAVVYSYGYGVRTMLGAAPRRGFGLAALMAPGEAVGPGVPSNAGRQLGLNVSYGAGPFFVGWGFHELKGNSAAINPAAATSGNPTLRQQTLSTAYDFGFMRLHAGLNHARNDAAGSARVDRRSWTLGATVPLGDLQALRVLVGQAHNRAAAQADWRALQVGYTYDLSRRSTLYAAYGFIDNEAAAATAFARSLGSFAAGSTPRAAIVGLKHSF